MLPDECSVGDIYIRYLSYNTAELLKADLVKRLPIKIDIGTREAIVGCVSRAVQLLSPVVTFAQVLCTPPRPRIALSMGTCFSRSKGS